VLPKRSKYYPHNKKISDIYTSNLKLHNFKPQMKKNSEENIQPIQVDPITGEYYITIPEWMMNDLSWYEDTEIEFTLESNEIVLREYEND